MAIIRCGGRSASSCQAQNLILSRNPASYRGFGVGQGLQMPQSASWLFMRGTADHQRFNTGRTLPPLDTGSCADCG